MCNHSYSVFSLTWPASIQIYWNKRERLHKSSTPTGLVWDTNMAAVSLFWDTNMAAMRSSGNTQLVQSTKFPLRCGMQKKPSYMTTY